MQKLTFVLFCLKRVNILRSKLKAGISPSPVALSGSKAFPPLFPLCSAAAEFLSSPGQRPETLKGGFSNQL